ncbi:hypothetical protein X976_6053 [Burkholderia pseudomallei MSHR7500]|nr:hypothetical protein X976_6053 [Burkholderia pseudomallei MSHR7500]
MTQCERILDDVALHHLAADVAKEFHVGAASDVEKNRVPGHGQDAAVAFIAEYVDIARSTIKSNWIINASKKLLA